MPIDHIGLNVPVESFDSIVEFYKKALTPLGYKEMMRPVDNVVGLGEKVPDFWIAADTEAKTPAAGQLHLAFSTMST
jgi:lactoylglutathione lyase